MKSLRSYTLGDQYVSPNRRLSAMLTQQGSKGGPSNSWQETMGRIAQQLAGAYIGYKDTQQKNKAFDAQTGLEPDSTSIQPNFKPDEIADYKAETNTRPPQVRDADLAQSMINENKIPTLSRQMSQPQIPEESFGPGQQGPGQPKIDGSGWDNLPDLSEVHRVNTYAGVPTPDPRDQMAKLMQESQSGQLNEKMNPRDYSMQQLRGLENNPYAKRILAQMMMQNADRDYASGLAKTQRGYADSDYDRKRAASQEDATTKYARDIERDKAKAGYKTPGTITTAEGVFIRNPDGTKGARLGSPHNQYGYNQGDAPGLGQTPPSSGIPAGRQPWESMPVRERGKMMSSSYKDASKMLEKNRQSLVANQTMSDSFKRFKYLNEKQDKEAENEYFGTKTGSLLDRMPFGGLPSFDADKIEMGKISSLLTPQMRQGMPGAASDRDVAMFANATVGIDTPKEINDSLIAGMGARFENANDRQAFMEEFLTQNKHLNGAEQEWRGYLEANPIFDPDPAKEGQYALNVERKGYKEYFSGGSNQGRRSGEPNNGGPLSPDEKKRLEELRSKARGQ